jgi:hypothetical protein
MQDGFRLHVHDALLHRETQMSLYIWISARSSKNVELAVIASAVVQKVADTDGGGVEQSLHVEKYLVIIRPLQNGLN